jgi:hypothetical protein
MTMSLSYMFEDNAIDKKLQITSWFLSLAISEIHSIPVILSINKFSITKL